MTPAGTSNELDAQNEWEENTTHKVLHCVCVCVCVFSSHSFWTSSSLDVPAGVTQEEGHTGLLIHLLSAVRALSVTFRKQAISDKLKWACSKRDRALHSYSYTILPFLPNILATAFTAAVHQLDSLDGG